MEILPDDGRRSPPYRHCRRRRRRTGAGDEARRSPWPQEPGARHARRPQPHSHLETAPPFRRCRKPAPLPARTQLHRAGALASFPLPQRGDDRPRPRRHDHRPRRNAGQRGTRNQPKGDDRLRHPGHGRRQRHQRFRNAGRSGIRRPAGNRGTGQSIQPPPGQCVSSRARSGLFRPPGPVARRHHRRRRDRHRARRRTAPHRSRHHRLRARPDRPGARPPHRADRGGRPHPAPPCRRASPN